MTLLRVVDAWFKYPGAGGAEALRGAHLEVRSGEVVAVLGPNGCGKTTLLLVAAGLLEPNRGEVLLDDKPLKGQLPEARRLIGLLFQNPDDQLFNPTVHDEIAFALRQLGLSADYVSKRVREVAAEFGVESLLSKPPYKLSFGEKKRVALASIAVYDPDLLLLDELTSNLPPKAVAEMEGLLAKWRKSGKGIVVAAHDVDFVARVADRVYLMNQGRIVKHGPARQVLSDEEALSGADLALPTPARIAKELGLSANPPLTVEELTKLLGGGLAAASAAGYPPVHKRRVYHLSGHGRYYHGHGPADRPDAVPAQQGYQNV